MRTDTIPEHDLPVVAPAAGAHVRGVQAGKSVNFGIGVPGGIARLNEHGETPPPTELIQRVATLEASQVAGMRGYATRAAMTADLAHPDGTLAVVTNDSAQANNTTYRKTGAPGAGSWVQAIDRVTAVAGAALQWRGTVPEGLIAATRTHGVYQLVPNGAYSDRPEGLAASKAAILTVHEMSPAGGRFQFHELRDPDIPSRRWVRRVDQNNQSAYPWIYEPSELPDDVVTALKLATGSVTARALAAAYSDRGTVSTGSANDIRSAGRYLVQAAVTDLPSDSSGDGFMDVAVTSTWVTQEFALYNEPAVAWRRTIRTSTGQIFPWRRISSSGRPEYVGKRAAFFGDSMTEFGDYPARVGTRLGLQALKFGFGGCRMANHVGTSQSALYDKMSMYNLARYIATGNYSELILAADALYAEAGDDNRAQALALSQTDWSTVDYIVLYWGANDFTGAVPLGTTTDSSGTTFRGAINYTVAQIVAAHPHIKILFVSPMWRSFASLGSGMDADTWTNGIGLKLVDYVDALKDQASRLKYPALDLFRTSGVNALNYTHWLGDEAHPAPGHGYQLLADKIGSFMGAHV